MQTVGDALQEQYVAVQHNEQAHQEHMRRYLNLNLDTQHKPWRLSLPLSIRSARGSLRTVAADVA